jgi:hypothetical protein
MRALKLTGLIGAVAIVLAFASMTFAQYATRQYYSGWNRASGRSYHYRTYYYKPSAKYSGYRHHYVVYYPSRPKYVYYYNPYKKQYWGRCPSQSAGKEQYQLLAEKDRKGNLEEIPESAFPQPTRMPPIPESDDDARVDVPPDDLPTDENLPGGDK